MTQVHTPRSSPTTALVCSVRRGKRRTAEWERAGQKVSEADVLADILRRDERAALL